MKKTWYNFFPICFRRVGLVRSSDSQTPGNELIERGRVFYLPQLRGTFNSSPSLLTVGGETFVLYRQYGVSSNRFKMKGRKIFSDGRWGKEFDLLSEAFLSTETFVFVDNTIPHALSVEAEKNRLVLYRALNFPSDWEKLKILPMEFSPRTVSVVWYRGRYWMFVSSFDDELHVFWADELTGEWFAHNTNPVKKSLAGVHSAGAPFVFGDRLYRPTRGGALDESSAVLLNRFEVLTVDELIEASVEKIKISADNVHGIHNLSCDTESSWMVFEISQTASPADICRRLPAVVCDAIIADSRGGRLFAKFS